MCFDLGSLLFGALPGALFGKKKKSADTGATPTKTGADIQAAAEQDRLKLNASQAGFAANILSGGFGDTADILKRNGITFGV
jgi:hypothetical protein